MENHTSNQIISFLQALNIELELLRTKSLNYLGLLDINSPQITSLLELENRAPTILSLQDSILSNLNQIKTLVNNLRSYQSYSPRSFVQRHLISYEISRIGLLIQKEIQLCFDRENIRNLVKLLQESFDEEKLRAFDQFEGRISTGFDLELQNLILKERLFPVFESILCDDSCLPTVREKAGFVIASLVQFNRNVFVGDLLMGFTIPTLVSMGSTKSLEILISLVRSCKGHLVNEMELQGEILKIIGLLNSDDLQVRLMAIHCLIEMAYFGKKKVIESMIDSGLIEKLVLLQRLGFESGSSEVVLGQIEDRKNIESSVEDGESGREKDESGLNNPFSGCIARFAVQVEVGEGMEKSERKEIKMEILRRARAACVSEAEAATVVAEVLWGSHP